MVGFYNPIYKISGNQMFGIRILTSVGNCGVQFLKKNLGSEFRTSKTCPVPVFRGVTRQLSLLSFWLAFYEKLEEKMVIKSLMNLRLTPFQLKASVVESWVFKSNCQAKTLGSDVFLYAVWKLTREYWATVRERALTCKIERNEREKLSKLRWT